MSERGGAGGAPGPAAGHAEKYVWKDIPGSSHDRLTRRILAMPPNLRLLDLGAAGGHLGRAVRGRCAYLAGVEPDPTLPASAREGYDDWRAVDALEAGDWPEPFDVVVCADVLEHVSNPVVMLARIRHWLRPGGVLLASLPNVANVSVRAALLFGRFEYTERGILDGTHVSFYTRSSARRLLERNGFEVVSALPTAMPYELALPALGRGVLASASRACAEGTARFFPTLFGYQFVFEALRR
ncbi:MAG TPA: class I SAM-dependent methyltransferase [Thermoanaerobaculia bacterium]|nr:class I SAM-dependent methyltransferase [Thermoanaerobaculia bacterium]